MATGSGVIISADGYIVTNNHVVSESSELEVVLNDKRSFKAKVVGTDPNTDLAVIKIEANALPFLNFGNSDDIRVGEWVLAVGNPFDLESTVTAGIISAKGRGIGILGEKGGGTGVNPIESFIQTDAAVNPGNSGGALVNLKGELIGINTAIISKTGNFTGYSFAVPVSLVRKVSGDLLKYGTVQRGFLGISQMREVNNKVAEELDLKAIEGIYIGGFGEASINSAAKAAGMKVGDVVTKIDGMRINTISKLTEAVGRHKPGDVIKVIVNRDGQDKELNVTLKNLSGNTNIVKGDEVASMAAGNAVTLESLGVKVAELSAEEKEAFNLDGGVKIVKLSSGILADQIQIEEGFVITKVDGKPVKSARELVKLIGGRKSGIRLEGFYQEDPSSKFTFSF
jgi:Do/DeqQ family serine protease